MLGKAISEGSAVFQRSDIECEIFKSARHVQKFTSIHDPIYNLHYFPRNQFNAADQLELRQAATDAWREIACLKSA